ncbi:MAG: hypothetical protein AB7N65_22380 [Vicinamibacterales bacterium]
MRSRPWIWFVVAGLSLGAEPRPSAQTCESRGPVAFVCGVKNPEDLVAVPGTSWVLASGLDGGAIHAVDARTFRATQVFPAASARQRHDRAVYGACPGPLDATAEGERFSAHGLNVRPGPGGRHTVYLVHHGLRESIEVFEIDATPASPNLTWIGCVVAPDEVTLNSVAPLPHGGFVATNPYNRRIADARNQAGRGAPSGEVREWEPGKGWSIVPGSESPGPNGIEVSSDGRWLYVNLWPARRMMRLSRGQTPIVKNVVEVPFHPDNIRWQSDGTLLSAGHDAPTMARATECLRITCGDAAARVARWDPKTLEVKEILRYPSDDLFFGATAALQVGSDIWIGSVRGTRIARYPAR